MIDPAQLPYFAYGSNLEPRQMTKRCPGHVVLGPARLDGYGLRFRGYNSRWGGAVATVERAREERTWGVAFTLTSEDFRALDDYEGYRGPQDPGNFYRRVLVNVHLGDGSTLELVTYAMRPEPEGRPSRRYRDAIVTGARWHALPPEYVAWLEGQTICD